LADGRQGAGFTNPIRDSSCVSTGVNEGQVRSLVGSLAERWGYQDGNDVLPLGVQTNVALIPHLAVVA